jgi:hypothetical protein
MNNNMPDFMSQFITSTTHTAEELKALELEQFISDEIKTLK